MAGALFLKLEGIDGESTDDEHRDEIDLLSWNWAMSNPITWEGKGLTSGRVSMTELFVTKTMDKASPNLMAYCCGGKPIPTGTLFVQRAAGDDKIQALKLELKDIVISSYSMTSSSGSGELPDESISLMFNSVTYILTPQDMTGKAEGSIEAGWDISANKPI